MPVRQKTWCAIGIDASVVIRLVATLWACSLRCEEPMPGARIKNLGIRINIAVLVAVPQGECFRETIDIGMSTLTKSLKKQGFSCARAVAGATSGEQIREPAEDQAQTYAYRGDGRKVSVCGNRGSRACRHA